MTLRVCALLIPRETTPVVALTAVTTLRAELSQRYPGIHLPESDIQLIEDILAGLRQTQIHATINKQHTPEGGSLTEEI